MNIKFLGAGYTPDNSTSVGTYLIQLFADERFTSFIGLTAFASQSGIMGLAPHILAAKKHLAEIRIVTGIDQKGTSKEALEALMELEIESYIFYQSDSIIFHPKVYVFQGPEHAAVIVGSSNLTTRGLFLNIEASVLVEIDSKSEFYFVKDILSYFEGIAFNKSENLSKIDDGLIKTLVSQGIVPTESDMREEQKQHNQENKDKEVILKIFPKRLIAKMPVEFRIRRKSKIKNGKIEEYPSPKGNLLWVRKSLPASSVQGGSQSTNPTGGLRLVQDKFKIDDKVIDQTYYFRYNLFSKFDWSEVHSSPLVEVAAIPFEVTIRGDYKGEHTLVVRHKPSGEAGQGNYTTLISWGPLGETIRGANLAGCRLELYAPGEEGGAFHLVITQIAEAV